MKRTLMMFLEIGLIVGLAFWVYHSMKASPTRHADGVEVAIQLPDAKEKAILYTADDGRLRYAVTQNDGQIVDLTADELAQRQHREQASRSRFQKLMNVNNTFGYLWVGLGMFGQVLFTGRMVVQWLVSEKAKKSTVPPIFWWMSLAGSTMLMAYFLWRRDPVGLLGQSFGWFIYIRNLWLIYRPHGPHSDAMMEAEGKEAEVLTK